MSLLVTLFNIAILSGLVWWMQRQRWAEQLRPYFYPALGLKLLCGLLLGLLYFEYYGGGDTVAYHQGSLKLTALAYQDFKAYAELIFLNQFPDEPFRAEIPFSRFPDFSNSFFLIKLLSVLNLLTDSSYYFGGLYFSLFSFWGSSRLAATLIILQPKYKTAATVAFLLFPSVIFWSSGLSKDALLFGSVCWIVAVVLKTANGYRASKTDFILLLPMLYLLYKVKFFVAMLLLPLLFVYLSLKVIAKNYPLLKPERRQVYIFILLLLLFIPAAALFFDIYMDGFFYSNLVTTHDALLARSQHTIFIQYNLLEPTLQSFILNAPEAVLSAVYRPFIWESDNALQILSGIENLVLLMLTLVSIRAGLTTKRCRISPEYVLFGFIVILFAAIFGLSTPNFGSLSRYRILFLPFLIYLFMQNTFILSILYKLKAMLPKRYF